MKKISLLMIMLAILNASVVCGEDVLTLEDYLKRAESENPDVIALDYSIQAAWQKVLEMDMSYSTIVSGSYNKVDDRSGSAFGSSLAVNQMQANVFNLSASRKFATGTNVNLAYSYASADYDLLSPLTFSGASYNSFTGYQLSPKLTLSQSLLRDLGAGLTESGIQKAKASVLAGQYMLLYKKQQLLLAARAAYWNLSLAREIVEFRKTSLERAKKLLEWNESKIKLDLVEKSDLLQTQAAYKLRQLNLQLAIEDEIKACRTFNQMLGLQCASVQQTTERISDKVSAFADIEELSKTGERADVLSAVSSYESSKLADRETKYRAMPELSLNGSYALNGLGMSYADAWEQMTAQAKPSFSIGVSFIVPLDYRTLTKVRKGYTNDFAAAKQSYKAAETAAKNDWDQLGLTWSNVKSRLTLAKEIAKIQEERAKNEQGKYEKGRTTTFLLLTAQNDMDDAVINVYRTVIEEIMTLAQAELFNTQPINNDLGVEK